METIQQVVKMITDCGMSVFLLGYFIYKDNTTQKSMLDAIQEMTKILAILKEKLDK